MIKAFIALFMDFYRPWKAGHMLTYPQYLIKIKKGAVALDD
jgi:hypothetical protein